MLAFIKEYQDLISGLFTLMAGVGAYRAVMLQIRADKAQIDVARKQKEVAFLTILRVALSSFRATIDMLERDVIGIRDSLTKGVNLRRSADRFSSALNFDLETLKAWHEYVTFDPQTIATIREFYDDYLSLNATLQNLRTLAVPADLPLLKTVNGEDEFQSVRAGIAAVLSAIVDSRVTADSLAARINQLIGRVDRENRVDEK